MSNFNIYQIKQLEAITAVLARNEAYQYRKICRWFSRAYSTPLKEVEQLPWDYLLTHYYEAQLEDMDYNNVFDLATENYIEEFVNEDEVLKKKLEEELVAEQLRTIKKKRERDKFKEDVPKIQGKSMKFDDEESEL